MIIFEQVQKILFTFFAINLNENIFSPHLIGNTMVHHLWIKCVSIEQLKFTSRLAVIYSSIKDIDFDKTRTNYF